MTYYIDSFTNLITPSKLDSIAQKSKFIQRSSNTISPHHFVLSLLQSIVSGKTSFQDLANNLNNLQEKPISRQAVHKRINSHCVNFLSQSIQMLLKKQKKESPLSALSGKFNRILIEDCTVLKIHQSNHSSFRGNGNGKFKTAGAKIHQIIDWSNSTTVHTKLDQARTADQNFNESIDHYLQENDLVLRDMGFFKVSMLERITAKKAHWISRLPASMTAKDEFTQKSLNTHLKDKSKNEFSSIFLVGSKDPVRCRIIAKRLPKNIAEAHKRKRRADAKRRGSTPKKESFLRDEWSIICCNEELDIPNENIYALYQIRWNIEIQFRGIKQSLSVKKSTNHKMNKYHLKCLLLAVIIYQILSLRSAFLLSEQLSLQQYLYFSYEKLCSLFSKHINNLTDGILNIPWKIDIRQISQEKRRRQTSYSKTLKSLG